MVGQRGETRTPDGGSTPPAKDVLTERCDLRLPLWCRQVRLASFWPRKNTRRQSRNQSEAQRNRRGANGAEVLKAKVLCGLHNAIACEEFGLLQCKERKKSITSLFFAAFVFFCGNIKTLASEPAATS